MSIDRFVAQVHPADRWRELGMKSHQPDGSSSDKQWHGLEISSPEVTNFSIAGREFIPAVVAAALDAHVLVAQR